MSGFGDDFKRDLTRMLSYHYIDSACDMTDREVADYVIGELVRLRDSREGNAPSAATADRAAGMLAAARRARKGRKAI